MRWRAQRLPTQGGTRARFRGEHSRLVLHFWLYNATRARMHGARPPAQRVGGIARAALASESNLPPQLPARCVEAAHAAPTAAAAPHPLAMFFAFCVQLRPPEKPAEWWRGSVSVREWCGRAVYSVTHRRSRR